MPTVDDSSHALDIGALHQAFAIHPAHQRQGDFDALERQVEPHPFLQDFIVLFIVVKLHACERIIVVFERRTDLPLLLLLCFSALHQRCMPLKLDAFRSRHAVDMYIVESDFSSFPVGHNGRIKHDGRASGWCKVLSNAVRDPFLELERVGCPQD